jgi:hypothetical protein
MKKLLILIIAVLGCAFINANQIKVNMLFETENSLGKKLTGSFKTALEKTKAYDLQSEIDNGVFVIYVLTTDPLSGGIIGEDISTIYNLVVFYMNDGYPIFANTMIGYCLESNIKDAADSLVINAMQMIGQFQTVNPELFNP